MGVVVDAQVQATAFVAAAARAAETASPAPRIHDEYAHLFAEAGHAAPGVRRRLLAAGTDEVVHRTVLLDRLLTERLDRDSCTVVSLGAGFCARPYRMDLSRCRRYVEVDAEAVLSLKSEILRPFQASCPVERVVGDVRDVEALSETCRSWSDGEHVVVISEGLLVYLPPDEVTALATVLADGLADATWLCDIVSPDSAAGMAAVADKARAGVTLYGLTSLDLVQEPGWTVTDYRPLPVATRSTYATGGSTRIIDGVLAMNRTPPRADS